jgi:hypothetical protein
MEHLAMRRMMETDDYRNGVLAAAKAGAEEKSATVSWSPSSLAAVGSLKGFFDEPKGLNVEEDLKLGILVNDSEGGTVPDNSKPNLDKKWLKDGFLKVDPEEEWELEPLEAGSVPAQQKQ